MDLDLALSDLYDGPPEEFVARRTELVAQLRAAGQREQAQAMARRRRPTVAADALNRLVRAQPALVREVLQAATALGEAQRRVLSGGKADLRGRGRAHGAAIDQLLTAAEDRAEWTAATAEAIRTTLLAAAVDDELAQQLASATLSTTADPPDVASAFAAGGPLLHLVPSPGSDQDDAVADDAPDPAPVLPGTQDPGLAQRAEEARGSLRKAEEEMTRATAQLSGARRREAAAHADVARRAELASELSARAEEAAKRAKALREQAADAAQALADARQLVQHRTSEVELALVDADEARQQLDHARRHLDGLA